MNNPSHLAVGTPTLDLGLAAQLAETEGVYLDEQRWGDWLGLWTHDCQYWAPCWKANGELGDDPHTTVSHIYYDRRSALEDRVSRFSDRNSPASNPLPRTLHQLTAFRLRESVDGALPSLAASWITHVYWGYKKTSHILAGIVEYRFRYVEGDLKIEAKKVILNNDMIPTMLDIYCL